MAGAKKVTRRWLLEKGQAIHAEWEKRHNTHPESHLRQALTKPYNKPNSFLKREVYRLVRHCLTRRSVDLLQMLVTSDESSPRPSKHNEQDPFYWGFMFVCGMDKRVSPQTRGKFANELLYAHKHDVPPDLLTGFIYQIGKSDGLRERLLKGEMEEWYEEKS